MHIDPIVLREKILVCGSFTEVHTINRVKLPISSIGNLCFLPEEINRGKHGKTIYQINLKNEQVMILQQL